MLEKLLTSGTAVNSRDQEGRTALSHAAEAGSKECVRLLLDSGAAVNAAAGIVKGNYLKRHESGRIPLHWAAISGQVEVVTLLLDRGARIESKGSTSERTALQEAASHDQYEVVKLLLGQKAEVNSRTHYGWTALHTAAQRRNPRLVELLLQHGANANAVYRKVRDFVKPPAKDLVPLHLVIVSEPVSGSRQDGIAVLELLLRVGKARISKQDSAGATALHYAVRGQRADAVEVLLKHARKEDVAIKDALGKTALDWAVHAEYEDIVAQLTAFK